MNWGNANIKMKLMAKMDQVEIRNSLMTTRNYKTSMSSYDSSFNNKKIIPANNLYYYNKNLYEP